MFLCIAGEWESESRVISTTTLRKGAFRGLPSGTWGGGQVWEQKVNIWRWRFAWFLFGRSFSHYLYHMKVWGERLGRMDAKIHLCHLRALDCWPGSATLHSSHCLLISFCLCLQKIILSGSTSYEMIEWTKSRKLLESAYLVCSTETFRFSPMISGFNLVHRYSSHLRSNTTTSHQLLVNHLSLN